MHTEPLLATMPRHGGMHALGLIDAVDYWQNEFLKPRDCHDAATWLLDRLGRSSALGSNVVKLVRVLGRNGRQRNWVWICISHGVLLQVVECCRWWHCSNHMLLKEGMVCCTKTWARAKWLLIAHALECVEDPISSRLATVEREVGFGFKFELAAL